MGDILKYAYNNMMQSYPSTVFRILKRFRNATEQVPYGKPTTEALGRLDGGPVNKTLAMAREENLPGNWLKRATKNN